MNTALEWPELAFAEWYDPFTRHRDRSDGLVGMGMFAGNPDAYGITLPDGGITVVHGPVTGELLWSHLRGDIDVGIYPLRRTNDVGYCDCRWGCIDIDTGDWQEAQTLYDVMAAENLRPHIETSKSKGWHLWVFPEDWVDASTVRCALKEIHLRAFGTLPKEAFPKQETLEPGQLGNFVRLPYYGKAEPGRRVFLRDPRTPPHISPWASLKNLERLAKAFHLRTPEQKGVFKKTVKVPPSMPLEKLREMLMDLPPGLKEWATAERPKDRSRSMVAYCHALRGHGYLPSEAFAILEQLDIRWGGKYAERPDQDKWVLDIVQRVYGRG